MDGWMNEQMDRLIDKSVIDRKIDRQMNRLAKNGPDGQTD